MNKYILILGFIFYSVTNVTAQNTTSDFLANNYEVQFLKTTGVGGTIVFKIYAYGKNQDQAVQNAKSDALKAVMFKGIPGSDLKDPLITDLSVLETQKAFFNTFFETNQYQQYIAISSDGSIDGEDIFKVGKKYKVGVVVSVQKDNLRTLLEKAGIIKRLDSIF